MAYSENLTLAGYDDWRLPNVKELQSIVQYTLSPSTNNSAAIDSMFDISSITDEGGESNYPFFWTSTTHANMINGAGALFLAFVEALGWMQPPTGGDYVLLDVHGAGAQRSDPKSGDSADYPYGHGPQGDVIRIFNYVRAVRLQSSAVESLNLSEDTSELNETSLLMDLTIIGLLSIVLRKIKI